MSTPAPAANPQTPASPDTPVDPRQARCDAYVQVSSPIMSTLALVYLVLFSLQAIFYDPGEPWYRFAQAFGNLLWVIFAVDLAVHFALTPEKRHFFRHNWLDTITVVFPQFRALRVLRAFTGDSILAKHGKGVLTGGAITSAVLGTGIIVWVGSLMVLSAERPAPNATITTFPDALWWAFETITTVGYGDFTPVTWLGRAYAVMVMFVGISVVGVVSASLAATLIKQNTSPPPPAQEVLDELAELKAMVASLQTASKTVPPAAT